MQERRDVMKEKLIEELKEGEVRKGRVSSICDFGAFVDIGGADGLVHLSELSWSRVRHPSEVLRVGQEVDVYVLGINAQEKKIALSIKRTQAEPWSQVAAKYEVGQLVRGTVTQLANFGAFARIEDGIEGLIHVSELTDERITHPKQVVKEGEELILRIIRIDPQRRRMGLSLRRALDTPDHGAAQPSSVRASSRSATASSQTIRAALEAEGIEPGSGRDDDDDDEPTSAAGGTAASRRRAAAGRHGPGGRSRAGSADAPMSAMEAAFARRGAEPRPTARFDGGARPRPRAAAVSLGEEPRPAAAAAAEPIAVDDREAEPECARRSAATQDAAAELEAAATELEEAVAEVEAVAETAGPDEVAEAVAAVEEAGGGARSGRGGCRGGVPRSSGASNACPRRSVDRRSAGPNVASKRSGQAAVSRLPVLASRPVRLPAAQTAECGMTRQTVRPGGPPISYS